MTRPLIFAHRGANHEAAENTRSAFDRALAYASDGIETDIQLSRDAIAVLWHDRFLGKAGLPDRRIDDFTYAQLQAMDFGAHFSAQAQAECIMTLCDFITAYRNRCRLLLEIKNRDWEAVERHRLKVRQTLELAGAHSFNPAVPRQGSDGVPGDAIMVSSFNLPSLIYAHQCAPAFPLIYNLQDQQTQGDAQHALVEYPFLHGLCLPIGSLDEALIGLVRAHGKCCAVYTCNSGAEIGKALQLGVDIIISDLPQIALEMRDGYSGINAVGSR